MKNVIFSKAIPWLLCICIGCVHPNKDENGFIEYIIEKGNQYSNDRVIKSIDTEELKFIAKFDSSAIYTTADTLNQLDINKLYGFIEDQLPNDHYNSARIGWRWYHNELQLFAYCYNKGTLEPETLIKSVDIGKEISCIIKKEGSNYVFNVDGSSVTLPRKSTSPRFTGNRLFPYFGGNEKAPHKIRILIKDI